MLKVYSIWINWRIKYFLTGLKGFKEWVYGYVLKKYSNSSIGEVNKCKYLICAFAYIHLTLYVKNEC
jgi:tyrosine-protein phosphatase YwqE